MDAGDRRTFFHGTGIDDIIALLEDPSLNPTIALQKRRWNAAAPGFYLATAWLDALYIGTPRDNGSYAARVDMTHQAYLDLIAAEAQQRAIPQGRRPQPFVGEELFIPLAAFGVFNDLAATGHITFTLFDYPEPDDD